MRRVQRIIAWIVASLAAAGFLIVLLLALAGVFSPKITKAAAPPERVPVGDRAVVAVESRDMPQGEWVVGTTRAVHETTLGSRLLARVVAVHIQAGQLVDKDEVLIELDDADLRAQLDEASARVAAATAALDQARTEHERISGLVGTNAASPLEMTTATNALRAAEAELRAAEKARDGAQTRLAYAVIRSPIAGRIVDKKVDVGDTVSPGQPLVSLYDHTHMQLVAIVRESLALRLRVGQVVSVRLDALGKACDGQVQEIVPEAATASRSFDVKVTGPCPPNVFPGMFGRLLVPLDPRDVWLIPKAAVHEVGQLDLVDVVDDGYLTRRLVRLGRAYDDDVEVLSGLRPGMRVALPSASTDTQPSAHGR